jgi:hypothetical protein
VPILLFNPINEKPIILFLTLRLNLILFIIFVFDGTLIGFGSAKTWESSPLSDLVGEETLLSDMFSHAILKESIDSIESVVSIDSVDPVLVETTIFGET